jgi:copper chaperone CopZ
MTTRLRWTAALVVALVVGAWQGASGADPKPTTITITEMDCPSCAKKIADKLAKVEGVAKAEADVKTKTVKVTPKPGLAPSPKELWEAVEKLEKTPTRLDGPSGVFTTKPKA